MAGNESNAGISIRLDNGALNGLRGLLSVHIALDHIIYWTCPGCKDYLYSTNLYGNVHMPFFYLLSGFTLALSYGQTLWKELWVGCKATTTVVVDIKNQNQDPQIFSFCTFYWNRLTRILPMYYLGTLLIM